mgnify:CR=1 FL=1
MTLEQKLGAKLRQVREKKGISLDELALQTRIDKKHLIAIEQGRLDALPGPIYIRSYLRSYAIYVGLNPQTVIKAYQAAKRSKSSQTLPAQNSAISGKVVKQEPREMETKQITHAEAEIEKNDKVILSRAKKEKQKRRQKKQKKPFSFGLFYSRMLILGYILLVIAAGYVLFLRLTTEEVDVVLPLLYEVRLVSLTA